jgi:hypothetical protein
LQQEAMSMMTATATTTTNGLAGVPGTLDVLTAGDLVDRLAGVSVDQLRALGGRLEDTHRVVKAILRERLALARRNAGWRARELAVVTDDGAEDGR